VPRLLTVTASQFQPSEPKLMEVPSNAIFSELAVVEHLHHADPYSACDDEIPTIGYSLLFSQNPNQQLHALQCLRDACLEYGFFYVTLFALVSYTIYFHHISSCLPALNLSSII